MAAVAARWSGICALPGRKSAHRCLTFRVLGPRAPGGQGRLGQRAQQELAHVVQLLRSTAPRSAPACLNALAAYLSVCCMTTAATGASCIPSAAAHLHRRAVLYTRVGAQYYILHPCQRAAQQSLHAKRVHGKEVPNEWAQRW